jgi:hypothetical protein
VRFEFTPTFEEIANSGGKEWSLLLNARGAIGIPSRITFASIAIGCIAITLASIWLAIVSSISQLLWLIIPLVPVFGIFIKPRLDSRNILKGLQKEGTTPVSVEVTATQLIFDGISARHEIPWYDAVVWESPTGFRFDVIEGGVLLPKRVMSPAEIDEFRRLVRAAERSTAAQSR